MFCQWFIFESNFASFASALTISCFDWYLYDVLLQFSVFVYWLENCWNGPLFYPWKGPYKKFSMPHIFSYFDSILFYPYSPWIEVKSAKSSVLFSKLLTKLCYFKSTVSTSILLGRKKKKTKERKTKRKNTCFIFQLQLVSA